MRDEIHLENSMEVSLQFFMVDLSIRPPEREYLNWNLIFNWIMLLILVCGDDFGNQFYLMVHLLTLVTCWFDFRQKQRFFLSSIYLQTENALFICVRATFKFRGRDHEYPATTCEMHGR